MTAPEEFDPKRAAASHIEPLTALRFFAAIWVVLFAYWPKLDLGFTPAAVAKGYLGVEVFFVLSGFILCHVYLAAVERGRFGYGGFLWARLARVYPLHLFTLVGVGALALAAGLAGFSVGEGVTEWSALPANLLMIHAWGFAPTAGWNHPSWSISAEWFAYLSFPVFALAAIRMRERPRLAVALTIGLLFALYAGFQRLTGEPLTQATIEWGALRIVPCFAYGCALFLLWRSGAVRTGYQALFGLLVSLCGLAAFAGLGAPDAAVVTAAGGLILFLAGLWSHSPAEAFDGPLGRFGVYLGEISYSVYMLAIPWSLVFVNGAGVLTGGGERLSPALWLLMTAGLVPLAALSYHLVERPARLAMRRFRQPPTAFPRERPAPAR
ncbi:MAG: acyltransferase [Pseudomonadota bacterium]|nr:acyltransferase [Pseudomonadota bacterium]